MNQIINGTVLVLLLIVAWEFFKVFLKKLLVSISVYRLIRKNDQQFYNMQKEMEKMKENGEIHEWVSINTGMGDIIVCKKTGWCPSINGFIPKEHIESYQKEQENAKKVEEEYAVYEKNKLFDLNTKYGVNMVNKDMKSMAEDVYAIKRDFYIAKIEEAQKTLLENTNNEKNV